ncbi:FAD-binding oxidoreductase [Jatrophihabitans sp.]|uniref:FAD-binding oxidoreductase n=1 Tax=Jatrophihabitans sp. TaxID=1932789 RepID=UPI002C123A57|nr:FAD-binding oxidoreductase [Jatrophihabitans sp.]
MPTSPLIRLRERISGEVVLPGEPAYPDLKNGFVHQGQPAAVVRCAGTGDVQEALRCAREEGLPVAVRSSGHSNAGLSTNDGGMVIDLRPMAEVELLDRGQRLVRLGSGATWGEASQVLGRHDLAISSGDTATVGVGGLLLGGGIGWLARRYGLAMDSLVAAELVTADGAIVRAGADSDPELFWALRGGGGNFGVVTAFELTASRVPGVFYAEISYPRSEAAAVLKGWRDYLRTAPEELTSFAYLYPSFGGDPMPLYLAACYAGDDPAGAERALAPLLALGPVLTKDVTPRPYLEMLGEPGPLPPGLVPVVKNRFADRLSDPLIDKLVAETDRLETLYVELRSLGGAVAAVDPAATAFACRGSEALVMTVLLSNDPGPEAEFGSMWSQLGALTSPFGYGNFLSSATAADVAAVYPPATYHRLAAVKARLDPDNVFRSNLNVPPAG